MLRGDALSGIKYLNFVGYIADISRALCGAQLFPGQYVSDIAALYESKFRHKVNDNGLKRRLAISHYKVGKLIGGFLASFGEESEYLSRDHTDRLKEIEDEMEQERKQREERENKVSRYQYGKE